MPRKDDYRGVTMHCVVCMNPIPLKRKWNAITCSPNCSEARKNFGRSRQDASQCRYCLRPCTPEERIRYHVWRKLERKGLNEEQSVAKLLSEVEQLKRKLAQATSKAADE